MIKPLFIVISVKIMETITWFRYLKETIHEKTSYFAAEYAEDVYYDSW